MDKKALSRAKTDQNIAHIRLIRFFMHTRIKNQKAWLLQTTTKQFEVYRIYSLSAQKTPHHHDAPWTKGSGWWGRYGKLFNS
jgi:hypothetical protein